MAEPSKARTGQKLVLAALFGCLLGAAAPAQSTVSVPLPTPRPAKMPQADVTGSIVRAKPAAALRQAQANPPAPISNPFASVLGKTITANNLDDKQRAIVARVNAYLSSTQQLTGRFVQIGPDGSRSQGQFFILKPGKVRFEYDDPTPVAVISNGMSVAVRNTRLATQDIYPLSETPLRFLLADRVDLMKDTNLVAVYADDVFATVVVEERNAVVGTSRLMMMFSATDMQLKQWTVTDPQGYDTTVAVYNLDTSKRPDPKLFEIDFTNYHN